MKRGHIKVLKPVEVGLTWCRLTCEADCAVMKRFYAELLRATTDV